MTTREAIDRAVRRLMAVRNPHRDLAQAMHNLLQARAENPLAGVPVVTIDELVGLLVEDDHQPAREPDWIDARMSRSVRLFAGPDAPLDTPARRRLAGATLRRNCPA